MSFRLAPPTARHSLFEKRDGEIRDPEERSDQQGGGAHASVYGQ